MKTLASVISDAYSHNEEFNKKERAKLVKLFKKQFYEYFKLLDERAILKQRIERMEKRQMDLIEKAFVAGRSKMTWEDFRKEHAI